MKFILSTILFKNTFKKIKSIIYHTNIQVCCSIHMFVAYTSIQCDLKKFPSNIHIGALAN